MAAITLVAINPREQMAKARDADRKQALRQLANALERYYVVMGTYPSTSGAWCGATTSNYNCGTANWIPDLVSSGEIKILPQDPRVGQVFPPLNNGGYVSYVYNSIDGKDYKLMAHSAMESAQGQASCQEAKFVAGTQDKFCDPMRHPGGTWGSWNTWSWSVWSSDTSKVW